MKLKFGKYKGQNFEDTPKSYQNWLSRQEWFKMPQQPLHKQLNGWDGYSKKGEAIYDEVFEQEKSHYINLGLECRCGLPKGKEDKFCQVTHCQFEGL